MSYRIIKSGFSFLKIKDILCRMLVGDSAEGPDPFDNTCALIDDSGNILLDE